MSSLIIIEKSYPYDIVINNKQNKRKNGNFSFQTPTIKFLDFSNCSLCLVKLSEKTEVLIWKTWWIITNSSRIQLIYVIQNRYTVILQLFLNWYCVSRVKRIQITNTSKIFLSVMYVLCCAGLLYVAINLNQCMLQSPIILILTWTGHGWIFYTGKKNSILKFIDLIQT